MLLGVGHGDTEQDANYLAEKISGLHIFGRTKMEEWNRSVGRLAASLGGFAVYALWRRATGKGLALTMPHRRNPHAGYTTFLSSASARAGLPCETGRFQEMMPVELVNVGPGAQLC